MEEERAPKRARLVEEEAKEDGENKIREIVAVRDEERRRPELPPELWALILEFTPYSVVMQCSAVSRFFLKKVLPKIQVICMDSYKQMDEIQTRRFSNGCAVKIVMISCYAVSIGRLCKETVFRTVPFLVKFASTIEIAAIGGRGSLRVLHSMDFRKASFVLAVVNYRLAAVRDVHESLLRSFSGAFSMGILPRRLRLAGMLHTIPVCRPSTAGVCSLCRSVCETFPLKQVVPYYLPGVRTICLDTKYCLDIIANRPGGEQLLQEPDTLCNVLRSFPGVFYKERTRAGENRNIRVIPGKLVDFLEELISYGADPSKMSLETLLDILRGKGQETIEVETNKPLIAESSYRELVRLKFDISEEYVTVVRNEPIATIKGLPRSKRDWPSGAGALCISTMI